MRENHDVFFDGHPVSKGNTKIFVIDKRSLVRLHGTKPWKQFTPLITSNNISTHRENEHYCLTQTHKSQVSSYSIQLISKRYFCNIPLPWCIKGQNIPLKYSMSNFDSPYYDGLRRKLFLIWITSMKNSLTSNEKSVRAWKAIFITQQKMQN